jgi:sec-independent protein translocase protein TatA
MGLDNPLHIALLVLILLLVFGAKRLPEIGRSLGSGMREFKQSLTGETRSPTIPAGTSQPQPPTPAQVPLAQPAPAEPVQQSPALHDQAAVGQGSDPA